MLLTGLLSVACSDYTQDHLCDGIAHSRLGPPMPVVTQEKASQDSLMETILQLNLLFPDMSKSVSK